MVDETSVEMGMEMDVESGEENFANAFTKLDPLTVTAVIFL